MNRSKNVKVVRGYCPQCKAICPTIAHVEDGIFTKVLADWDHPNSCTLCPKGLAGPEMVYSPARLKFPLRRTRPKGDPDPGWERISWDEALDTIATRLIDIKTNFGPEAVAFYRPANGGSPSKDWVGWFGRLANVFGSPNVIFTTHICNWHKDSASAYTYGVGIPEPEFDKSACILIWGHNPHHTWPSHVRDIERGLDRGAKLIVIDPRRIELVEQADLWLQVHPGTDGALALGLLHVVIGEGLYDEHFVSDWTNAPFLVRMDDGKLLRADELAGGGDHERYMVWDQTSQSAKAYDPSTMSFETNDVSPALGGTYCVDLIDGKQVQCRTAFQLLSELVLQYSPERVHEMTSVPADKIRQAARMFATMKPASYYTYNGIEQQTNATQTNRAICLLYAFTGNFDAIGSNRILPKLPGKQINGLEFLTPEIESKRLGASERPLGPPGTIQRVSRIRCARANDVYRAIVTGDPYPIKGLMAFGGNVISANPESLAGREAVSKLDFFVQAELFMTPPAQLADIVLPAASYWETWDVRTGFAHSAEANCHVQLREAVVPPQHEAKSDTEIIFEIAQRLGLGDKFWDGDIEAAFNYQLSPLRITVDDLRGHPGGITFDVSPVEKKYSRTDEQTGMPVGFKTPCRRIEIYSEVLKDHGHEPLPVYQESMARRKLDKDVLSNYPLTLTNFKLLEYCHGWGRCLPSLRRRVPEPFVEINPATAKELNVRDGELVALETPDGSIKVKARLTDVASPYVVCVQHGWWQGCEELGLPGYDLYSSDGRNVNLLYSTEVSDSLSGSFPMKGYPCRIRNI